MNRRDALKALTVGGVSFFLPPLSTRAAERRGRDRAKSLLLVWLGGGPSQLETWDPHPGTKIGGPTTAIDTSFRGVRIGADYPRTAEVMKHFSVVRSLVSKEGDHERGAHYMLTGYRPDPTVRHTSITSLVTKLRPDSKLEIPPHVGLGDIPRQFLAKGGFLGAEYDAFRVWDPGRGVSNLKSRVDEPRQRRRLEGLDVLTKSFRGGRTGRLDRTLHDDATRKALTMMESEQLAAFQIEEESEPTKAAYGDTQFGRGCLVARRLIETGVRAIQVGLNGFDTHADNFGGHKTQADILDPALAALTHDLVERDLWRSTTVLVLGEFGRTPQINPLSGRDHWPTGFSCLVGGGGVRPGVVVGETDPEGVKTQPSDPVTIEQLYATVLSSMGIDPSEELMTPIGRPLRYADGSAIERLLA